MTKRRELEHIANPQLDVGGGATADAVKKAFELLLSSKDVKSIFVNICKSRERQRATQVIARVELTISRRNHAM